MLLFFFFFCSQDPFCGDPTTAPTLGGGGQGSASSRPLSHLHQHKVISQDTGVTPEMKEGGLPAHIM